VEGGAKLFLVFRVKNHDFTQKKIIFFSILGGLAPGFLEANGDFQYDTEEGTYFQIVILHRLRKNS
jgi:hypothetical protein